MIERGKRFPNDIIDDCDERLISLSESVDNCNFQDSLRSSGGKARVIVHPFYIQNHKSSLPSSDNTNLELYNRRLAGSITRYLSTDTPIIFFEEHNKIKELQDNLNKYNLDKIIFLVKTNDWEHIPLRGNIYTLLYNMQRCGLNRAVVSGSYFWLGDDRNRGNTGNSTGCVGFLLKTMNSVGIKATPAFATYPIYK